jgi:hypothetical protein
MLSEFKTKTSGLNVLFVPLINLIGIVFPVYSISPVCPLGIT